MSESHLCKRLLGDHQNGIPNGKLVLYQTSRWDGVSCQYLIISTGKHTFSFRNKKKMIYKYVLVKYHYFLVGNGVSSGVK